MYSIGINRHQYIGVNLYKSYKFHLDINKMYIKKIIIFDSV